MNERDVIYDWNVQGHQVSPPMRKVDLHDETLRDGLQSPSVFDPDIEKKRRIIRLLDELGVHSADVGLPGAGPRAYADTLALVEMIRDEGLKIRPCAAGRTIAADIAPIIEISEKTGVKVEVMAFLGSSPIRMYAEGWDEDRLTALTVQAVKMSVEAGLPTSFVTEDTTRAQPKTLKRLFEVAVEHGADRLVLCDTVGHSTPNGVFNLMHWAHDLLLGLGARDRVRLDWHQHNDRGLALVNSLYAIEAGADRIHGTILGIGERVGNTSLDHLLVNLKLLGFYDQVSMAPLAELVSIVAEAVHRPVPLAYPVFGDDAFRTGTGVHAAAVIKAEKRGDHWLADRIYSGVPASWFGREQEIAIGHMSGESNVRYWLAKRGIAADAAVVKAILDRAKGQSELLTEDQVLAVVASASQG